MVNAFTINAGLTYLDQENKISKASFRGALAEDSKKQLMLALKLDVEETKEIANENEEMADYNHKAEALPQKKDSVNDFKTITYHFAHNLAKAKFINYYMARMN